MTPISRIDHLPYSGGLIAGVELEPEGLRLLAPATLTIQPNAPAPPNQTLTYAYGRGGENLTLYPRLIDTEALSLPILHFSGYGAGNATAADAAAQAAQTPSGPLADYVHQYSYFLSRFLWYLIPREELTEAAIEIFSNAYLHVVVPLLNQAKETCEKHDLKVAMNTAFDFLRFIQIFGLAEDLRMQHITPEVFALAIDILETCEQKAFDRCVALNDPYEASLILYIARQLQLLGVENPFLTGIGKDSAIESCLRFELDFQSKFVQEASSGPVSATERLRYRSQHVPLRLDLANQYAYSTAWSGYCKLVPEIATLDIPVCTATVQAGNGHFNGAALWIDGLIDEVPTATVRLLYDPGDPQATASFICPEGHQIPGSPVISFATYFGGFHSNEMSIYGLYMAKDWDLLRAGPGPSSNGWYFAKKSYERTIPGGQGSTLTEETHIFLKHTPNAPMPDCQ